MTPRSFYLQLEREGLAGLKLRHPREKRRWIARQHAGDAVQLLDRDVHLATFDAPHVAADNASGQRQCILRKPDGFSLPDYA